MAKISTTVVNQDLRNRVFAWLMEDPDSPNTEYEIAISNSMKKINDRQYGCILTDLNGIQRYIRIGAIVAELREDMTAEELMQKEIDEYNTKQTEKEAKAQARAEKAKKDKERRAKKQEEEQDDPNQFLPHEVTV